MARQVIHEQADLGITVGGSELLQVLLELLAIHRLWELDEQLLALLSRNARQDSHGGLIDPGLVDRHVLVGQAVLGPGNRAPGEHGLIEVDDTVAVAPGPLQSCDHLALVSSILGRLVLSSLFHPLDAPSLDFVHPIDLTQKRSAHRAAWELSSEVLSPLDQW